MTVCAGNLSEPNFESLRSKLLDLRSQESALFLRKRELDQKVADLYGEMTCPDYLVRAMTPQCIWRFFASDPKLLEEYTDFLDREQSCSEDLSNKRKDLRAHSALMIDRALEAESKDNSQLSAFRALKSHWTSSDSSHRAIERAWNLARTQPSPEEKSKPSVWFEIVDQRVRRLYQLLLERHTQVEDYLSHLNALGKTSYINKANLLSSPLKEQLERQCLITTPLTLENRSIQQVILDLEQVKADMNSDCFFMREAYIDLTRDLYEKHYGKDTATFLSERELKEF